VLSALALPLILVEQRRLTVSPVHPPLWGVLLVVVLAALRVNLSTTVTLAGATVAILRALG
jgi:hypothetical protein